MPCTQIDTVTHEPLTVPQAERPLLICVIDTEEEFDWNAEPSRDAVSVEHMDSLSLIQDIFDEVGLVPCYVVDYPIVSNDRSATRLEAVYRDGRCEIGAHLHPWVTPPFDECLSRANMYPGNLDAALERAKLETLTAAIEQRFSRPIAYKAGRYGVGPNTFRILDELGYELDLSYCPGFDCSDDGGPDYASTHSHPAWVGARHNILEIPTTGAFTGYLRGLGPSLFPLAQRLRAVKAQGILSRLGLLDRLMLSPEGYSSKEHIALMPVGVVAHPPSSLKKKLKNSLNLPKNCFSSAALLTYGEPFGIMLEL